MTHPSGCQDRHGQGFGHQRFEHHAKLCTSVYALRDVKRATRLWFHPKLFTLRRYK